MSRTDIMGGTGTPNPVAYIVKFWKDERAALRAKSHSDAALDASGKQPSKTPMIHALAWELARWTWRWQDLSGFCSNERAESCDFSTRSRSF